MKHIWSTILWNISVMWVISAQ